MFYSVGARIRTEFEPNSITVGLMCMCGMQGVREIVHDAESFLSILLWSKFHSKDRNSFPDEFIEAVSISFQNRMLTKENVRDSVQGAGHYCVKNSDRVMQKPDAGYMQP